MKIEIAFFHPSEVNELSHIIYEAIGQLEKENPDINYQKVRGGDVPEDLLRVNKIAKIWTAKANGQIAGTISLRDNRVRRFFVHPRFQKRGIGRKLVTTVIEHAKANNMQEIRVGALLSAVFIYKKLGFMEEKVFFNPEINQKEMEMRLNLE